MPSVPKCGQCPSRLPPASFCRTSSNRPRCRAGLSVAPSRVRNSSPRRSKPPCLSPRSNLLEGEDRHWLPLDTALHLRHPCSCLVRAAADPPGRFPHHLSSPRQQTVSQTFGRAGNAAKRLRLIGKTILFPANHQNRPSTLLLDPTRLLTSKTDSTNRSRNRFRVDKLARFGWFDRVDARPFRWTDITKNGVDRASPGLTVF